MAGTVGEMRCRENQMKCELCGREMNSYNSYNSYTDTLTDRKAVVVCQYCYAKIKNAEMERMNRRYYKY